MAEAAAATREAVNGGASAKGPVVVTGASGFVGSWLVMKLLQAGYTVRATVRDPGELHCLVLRRRRSASNSIRSSSQTLIRSVSCPPANVEKTKPLLDLPGAPERLSLWKADMAEEGSFDDPIRGCTGVFHVATPMDFESKDPEVRSVFWLWLHKSTFVIACTCTYVHTYIWFPLQNEVIKPTVEGLISILRACKEAGTVRRIVFTSSAGTVNVEERRKPVYDEDSWTDVDFCRRVKMTGWVRT